MIDRARDESVADRGERKMQRHALRRFDHESFVGGDDGRHVYEFAAWFVGVRARTVSTASGYSSCSCTSMRADKVATVSFSSTGTSRCAMIGPPSRVSSTKCTVQPAILTS